MVREESKHFRSRGNVLITALAVAAMSAIMITGVSILATSQSKLLSRDADYAAAMQMAEAGVNYELWWLRTNSNNTQHKSLLTAYSPPSSPTDRNGAAIATGSFKVYVQPATGTGNWTAGTDMKIISIGTVNGVTRTLQATAKAAGGATTTTRVFDKGFAAFANYRLLFQDASSAISGVMGANGPPPSGVNYSVTTQSGGVGNASPLTDGLVLAGGATVIPGNSINPNEVNNKTNVDKNKVANRYVYPTVDSLAASTFPNGWTTINSSSAITAQWARMRQYKTQGRVLSPSGTKALTTVTSGTVLANAALKTYADDGQPTNCLIMPPGDYYFTRMQLDNSGFSGGAPILYIDTKAQSTGGTPGPVRIWISGTDSQSDYLRCEIRYTATTDAEKAQNSRIFYNKNNTLSITGNGTYAGFYAVRSVTDNTSPATIVLEQSAKVWGTVVADYLTIKAGVNITYPSGGVANSTDPVFSSNVAAGGGAYDFKSWEEIPWRSPTTGAQMGSTVFNEDPYK